MYFGGTNGNSTLTGKIFENKTDLKTSLIKNNINIDDMIFIKQYDFPNYFFEQTNEKMETIFGKKFLPDEAVIYNNNLLIIEKKYQTTNGSVDEKLQTGPYKLEIFKECAKKLGLNKVKYCYLVNSDFFNTPKFTTHIIPWLKQHNIDVYFDSVPLEEILV